MQNSGWKYTSFRHSPVSKIIYFGHRAVPAALVALLAAILLCVQSASAQAPFKDLKSYVKWVQSHHKVPFDRDGAVLPPAERSR